MPRDYLRCPHCHTVFLDPHNVHCEESGRPGKHRNCLYQYFSRRRTCPNPKCEREVPIPGCSICFRGVHDRHRVITRCNHTFHSECLGVWFRRCKNRRFISISNHFRLESLIPSIYYYNFSEKQSCPMCREDLTHSGIHRIHILTLRDVGVNADDDVEVLVHTTTNRQRDSRTYDEDGAEVLVHTTTNPY